MAYNELLAQRVRTILIENQAPALDEKRMFGGVGFMVQGNMACGVHGDELIVRIGPQGYAEALGSPHVRPFDLSGRPMTGWVMVASTAWEDDASLRNWVQRGVGFAVKLPEK